MAWGAPRGLEDVNARLRAGDPKLTALHIMRFRRLNDEDVAGLCAALAANTVLTELSCSCHPIPPASAARLGAALAANGALRSVSVGDSSFGDAGLAAMAEGLAANKGLTRLDLENKGLTAAGAKALAACLEAHPRLEDVTLSRNDLGAEGVSALCVPWRALRRLDLSSCGLGAAAAAALAAASAVGGLASLSLAGNELGPAAGPALAQLLAAAANLESLDLGSTRLGPEGVEALAKQLPAAARLRSLDLSNCGLGAAGCAALAAALGERAARAGAGAGGGPLRLVLGPGNGLEDADVVTLADALAAGKTGPPAPQQQQEEQQGEGAGAAGAPQAAEYALDLSGVDLGAAGVRALARLPGLAKLVLFGSMLADGTVAALWGEIASGGGGGRGFASLRELNLAGCRLGLAALKQLLAALEAAADGLPLRLVEVGANPGADEEEFQEAAAALRELRPGLDVHWRAADGSSEGAGQLGGGGMRLQPPCPEEKGSGAGAPRRPPASPTRLAPGRALQAAAACLLVLSCLAGGASAARASLEQAVLASGLFNATWYSATYPDVAGSGLSPVQHFLRIGGLKGYDPGPDFSSLFYATTHPRMKQGENPLAHYLTRPPASIAYDGRLVAYAADKLVDRGAPEQAFKLASRHVPVTLRHTLHLLQANAAQRAGRGDLWQEHVNAFLAHYGVAGVRVLGAGGAGDADVRDMFARLSTGALPPVADGPLVTVILPARNAEASIGWSAQSILNQTWQPLELIIVDDASTDGTWRVISDVAKRDARVRALRNKVATGPYVAKNIALFAARGEYVTGQDADDWSHPQRLERQMTHILNRAPGTNMSLMYMVRMTQEGRFPFNRLAGLRPSPDLHEYYFDGLARLAFVSALFKRDFLASQLGFWDSIRYAADADMIFRATLAAGAGVMLVPNVSMFCLDSPKTLSGGVATKVDSKAPSLTPARRRYSEDSKAWWHSSLNNNSGVRMGFPAVQRPFPAPSEMVVPIGDVCTNLQAHAAEGIPASALAACDQVRSSGTLRGVLACGALFAAAWLGLKLAHSKRNKDTSKGV